MALKYRYDYIGLSTDAKPEDNVVDGSTFYEADTSKIFFFTKGNWYEKTSNVLTNIEKEFVKW